VKDAYFKKVRAVRLYLSEWPLSELKRENISDQRDRQVFDLQQRSIGETLIVGNGADTASGAR